MSAFYHNDRCEPPTERAAFCSRIFNWHDVGDYIDSIDRSNARKNIHNILEYSFYRHFGSPVIYVETKFNKHTVILLVLI